MAENRPFPWIVASVTLRGMTPDTLTLRGFQEHIRERYETTDRARGTPATFLWFIEEVGELSHALARQDDRANMEEEFADVLAWLCTLANINDVDLSKALGDKYLGAKRPEGTK
jgi:NTP pyrophosphatase (non-canonical NTP hydrolase)